MSAPSALGAWRVCPGVSLMLTSALTPCAGCKMHTWTRLSSAAASMRLGPRRCWTSCSPGSHTSRYRCVSLRGSGWEQPAEPSAGVTGTEGCRRLCGDQHTRTAAAWVGGWPPVLQTLQRLCQPAWHLEATTCNRSLLQNVKNHLQKQRTKEAKSGGGAG